MAAAQRTYPVGEEWLFQSWSEAYLPLLDVLGRLAADGARDLVTVGITPVLAEQVDDPKELVGQFKNAGRQWRPKGQPVKAKTHDFPDPAVGKAVPYGVYDIGANAGFVAVGSDGDTATFAVQTLRRWWQTVGQGAYPQARRLLVCADAGGSNGYRLRLWKVELARLAEETGLKITVCHFPPGTSKWNKIEHRLFAQITSNWRGEPLTSHEVVVDLIGATTTQTGLRVHAERDTATYPRGIKVSDAELAAVRLQGHHFHGDWNYTVRPPPRRAPRTQLQQRYSVTSP